MCDRVWRGDSLISLEEVGRQEKVLPSQSSRQRSTELLSSSNSHEGRGLRVVLLSKHRWRWTQGGSDGGVSSGTYPSSLVASSQLTWPSFDITSSSFGTW